MGEEEEAKTELQPMEVVRETADEYLVRIIYEYPDPQLATFANHFAVQHNEHEFLLSFYQLIPPLGVPGHEALRKQAEQAGGFLARCVAKIAIPKDRMPSIVTALVENLAKQQTRPKKSPEKRHDSHPQPHDSHQ
jgi:hypothetical protein